jgi:hypothetical protein
MLPAYPNPHPPNCPWQSSADLLGAPNIKWCETTLCSWISEPANTWSNLLYLVLGMVIYLQCRRSHRMELRWMGPAMVAMGLLSGVYHASNNYLSQVLDFLGMFLLVFWFLVINLRRNGWVAARAHVAVFTGLVAAGLVSVHTMYLVHWPFQWLIALATAATIATEFSARRFLEQRVPLGRFLSSLVLMAVAQAASLADLTRALCDPDNHFVQGHAVWHVVSAMALYLACQHYRLVFQPGRPPIPSQA